MRAPGSAEAAGAVLALLLATFPAAAQDGERDALIEAVRAGGTTVACRHAITDDTREREPVDYDDPSTQRLLSGEGEEQSRRMGRALRTLGLGFEEVVASPMDRARRTAELMDLGPVVIDSVWHTNGGDYGGPARAARRHILATPPPDNRLVVSHIGTLRSVLPDIPLGEGDCAVVRAEGGAYALAGVVPWEAWIRAARGR